MNLSLIYEGKRKIHAILQNLMKFSLCELNFATNL